MRPITLEPQENDTFAENVSDSQKISGENPAQDMFAFAGFLRALVTSG
ncbi:MAG: hypothetical protein OXC93_06965 [Rhodospirillaceae bacterium]|nr:hypothetical protein [Rhodospirillaceae bacterium]